MYPTKFVGEEVARVTKGRYGAIDYEWGIKSASTDFVSAIHDIYIYAALLTAGALTGECNIRYVIRLLQPV